MIELHPHNRCPRPSFAPEPLRAADMWGASLLDQMICRFQFQSLRYKGRYTPAAEQGTLVYPGKFGVFNWGSITVDSERQVMFGMPLYLAFTSKLVAKHDSQAPGGDTNQGEQMVVLVAGGGHGSVGTTMGDYILAYELAAEDIR